MRAGSLNEEVNIRDDEESGNYASILSVSRYTVKS